MEAAKPGFRHPKRLWREYWQRYNTITTLDEDAYFADALAAANRAKDRKHLEELLCGRANQRREDLGRVIADVAMAAIRLRHPFQSDTVRKAALKVGRTGSLDSFLQFVCVLPLDGRSVKRRTAAHRSSTTGLSKPATTSKNPGVPGRMRTASIMNMRTGIPRPIPGTIGTPTRMTPGTSGRLTEWRNVPRVTRRLRNGSRHHSRQPSGKACRREKREDGETT